MATVNLYVGQSVTLTPDVTGSDSNQVPGQGFSIQATIANPTIVGVAINPSRGSGVGYQPTAVISGLAAGTTTIVWTFVPNTSNGYTGSNVVLGADTFVVAAARTLSSATVAYSTPA
jgi:hypothetical protein